MLKKLYTPKEMPMQVAAPMSGSGTNTKEILRNQQEAKAANKQTYNLSVIITDNNKDKNRAWEIAKEFGVPHLMYSNFREFSRSHITNPKDMSQRYSYFEDLLTNLEGIRPKIDLVALAGYMTIVTEPFLSFFKNRIINVHPADLSIRDANGKAIFVGDHAVRDAILAGQKEIRSSTHFVTKEVDQGPVLLISKPVPVVLPAGTTLDMLRQAENEKLLNKIADDHQDELKKVGDWVILPQTLEYMAQGLFAKDEGGVIYLNSIPIQNGFKVDMSSLA
jgi:folate-dependent phosphoribosylglycinamide formyltransferase PurN